VTPIVIPTPLRRCRRPVRGLAGVLAAQEPLEPLGGVDQRVDRHVLAALVRLGREPGAEVERRDAHLGEAGHVGPRLLAGHRRGDGGHERPDQGGVHARGRRRRTVHHRHLGAVTDPFGQLAFGVLDRTGGGEAQVQVDRERPRDDVADRRGRGRLVGAEAGRPRLGRAPHVAVGDPVDLDVAHVVPVELREERPGERERVPAVPRPGRVRLTATEGELRLQRAEAAELHLPVGGLEDDREVGLHEPGHRGEHRPQLVGLGRPLLAGVEHEREVERRAGPQVGVLEGPHGEHVAGLHVGCPAGHDDLATVVRGEPGHPVVVGRGDDVEVADEQHEGPVAPVVTAPTGAGAADDQAVAHPVDRLAAGRVAGRDRGGERLLGARDADVTAVLEEAVDEVGPQVGLAVGHALLRSSRPSFRRVSRWRAGPR
jgi:hypothetical protein